MSLGDRGREGTLGSSLKPVCKDLEIWRAQRKQKDRGQPGCWGTEQGQTEPPLSTAISSDLCSFSSADQIMPKFLAVHKNLRKQGHV